jgi:hypothetical protein
MLELSIVAALAIPEAVLAEPFLYLAQMFHYLKVFPVVGRAVSADGRGPQ